MDFIIKLLRSKNLTTKKEYDTILVIIDKLTKYSHIILFKKKYIAKQLGTFVLNSLIYSILRNTKRD